MELGRGQVEGVRCERGFLLSSFLLSQKENIMSYIETLKAIVKTLSHTVSVSLKAHRERFPHLCTDCEGDGVRPEAEGGFEVCSSCVARGLDPLDTRLSLLCDAEGLTPQEAVEEGELDALTLRSTGANLTDWQAHPQRELEALQEELWEVMEELKAEGGESIEEAG
jgi:hypothetical protein